MKSTRNPFTTALFATILASPMAQATEYIYNNITTNTTGTATSWAAGTNWSAVPVSAAATTLTFGNGASLAASQTIFSANDIASPPFKLNILNMTYAGPASGTAPTVTIQGSQLEFISNGATDPTMVFNTTGTVKPTVTISAPILFTNTSAITTTTDAILSGTLSGSGGFTKSGAGTLRITGNATSTGGTALGNIGVSAGTLQIGNNGGFGSLGSGTITLSGSGNLNVARASNSFNLDNTITGSTSGAVNFYLNNSATPTAFAVTLTKANNYTAATNLQPFSSSSVGTPTLKNGIDNAVSTTTAFTINTVTGSSAVMTYDLAGFNQTIGSLASGSSVTTTNGIVTNSGAAKTLIISNTSGSTTYAGTISGAIALTKSGASTQVLSGTNSYTGNTSISDGTLSFTGSLTGGGVVATSGAGILNQSAAGVISGASTVTQGSSGTSILAGSNSYSGLTTVNAGVLQVNHANALGTTTNGTTVNGSDGSVNFLGTVLDLNGVAVGSGESLNLDSGTTTNNRVTLRSMSGTTSSWAGNVVLAGNKIVQLQTNNASSQLAISGGISGPSFTGNLNLRGAGTGTLSGGISLASTNNIQVLDGGTWNINTSSNTWGSTSLSNGALVTGAANALPNSQFITLGNSANSGMLKLNGFDQTVGGLAVTGTGTANKIVNGSGTASTLTVSHASNNSTFSGVLGGTGTHENNFGLTKSGASTLTLSGTNTYSGATLISGGTLKLDATGTIDNTSGVSLGTGGTFDVSLKSGYTVGTLKGSGNVTGALTVSTQLAIGNSPGTTNFSSSLTLDSATYVYEMTGGLSPGSGSADLGNVAVTLAIGAGSILDLVELGTYTAGNKFTLFGYGTLSGTFDGLANNANFLDDLSNTWRITYDDTTAGANGGTGTKFVTITAVPEPNTALIGGIGILFLLRRRRNDLAAFRS
jgi:fibronectin-binding autotransporter adhesin